MDAGACAAGRSWLPPTRGRGCAREGGWDFARHRADWRAAAPPLLVRGSINWTLYPPRQGRNSATARVHSSKPNTSAIPFQRLA